MEEEAESLKTAEGALADILKNISVEHQMSDWGKNTYRKSTYFFSKVRAK